MRQPQKNSGKVLIKTVLLEVAIFGGDVKDNEERNNNR